MHLRAGAIDEYYRFIRGAHAPLLGSEETSDPSGKGHRSR